MVDTQGSGGIDEASAIAEHFESMEVGVALRQSSLVLRRLLVKRS
jgi:hypothetical protein